MDYITERVIDEYTIFFFYIFSIAYFIYMYFIRQQMINKVNK